MEITTVSYISGCIILIGFIVSISIGTWMDYYLRHYKWIAGFTIRTAIDESGIFVRLEGSILKCFTSKRINQKTCYSIFQNCDDIQFIRFGEVDECFDLQLAPKYDLQNVHWLLLKLIAIENFNNEEIKIWTPIVTTTETMIG